MKATTSSAARRIRRILILTQYYAPESGAASIRLRALAGELNRSGFDVRVLTGFPNYPTGRIYPGYAGRFFMSDHDRGIPVTRVWLYAAAGKGAARRLLNYLSFTVSSAIALMFQPRADLVFVEAQPITLAIPALINRMVRGTPYVYNTPDLQVEYAEEDRWVGAVWLIRAARSLERFLMHQALSVTTVTRAFIEHFHRERGVPRDRLSFLPNGADIDQLQPQPYDLALAHSLGLSERKVFTFAGTYAPYQGLEVILDAAALLRHRADIAFLMIGDGPVRPRLVQNAKDRNLDSVRFHPTIPLSDMPRFMSITWASLLVLRKLEIAKKMRLAKAIPPLACGVPLVFAGWGESGDMVEQENVGIRVEPEDPAELAAAIERLADDRPRRDAMGRRGRALAEREFAWPVLVANWVREIESAYGRLIDPPG